MSRLMNVLKASAKDNTDVLLLLRVLVFLNAGKSIGDFARLVDMMIDQRVNPFAELSGVNPQVIEEVLDVITELDKPAPSTISAPPEQPPVGLMDGDTIALVNGNGHSKVGDRARAARRYVLRHMPGDGLTFGDITRAVFDPQLEGLSGREARKRFDQVGGGLVQQFKREGLIKPVEGKRGVYIRVDVGKRKLKKLMRRT